MPQATLVTVDEDYAGQRLDNFLIRQLKGVPKTHVYRIIRSGEVRVNKGRAHADTRVEAGDIVRLPPVRTSERAEQKAQVMQSVMTEVARHGASSTVGGYAPAAEFPILFEDDFLLAIDKPAGVAVHGGSGVSSGVIEQLRRARLNQAEGARFLELVHRLDRETSGVLLLAKRRSALTALQEQFRARDTGKVYAALVFGAWPTQLKVIDLALLKTHDAAGERHVRVVSPAHEGALRSITLVKVIRPWTDCSLLDVTIKTGRTHQIRVHLAHSGHPVVGDPKYGQFAQNKAFARERHFSRMFLHARQLAFDHPASGERITLAAPLPAECETLLRTP